jgi:hypothetical protein
MSKSLSQVKEWTIFSKTPILIVHRRIIFGLLTTKFNYPSELENLVQVLKGHIHSVRCGSKVYKDLLIMLH